MKPLVRMVCESEDIDEGPEWRPHPKTVSAECNHCVGEVYLEVNKAARDALMFCIDRLVYVYGESPNVDFILHAREALESLPEE